MTSEQKNIQTCGIRVAILPSFTFAGVDVAIKEECMRHKISAEVYVGKYNQYAQEIFDAKGGLYAFDPKVVFLAVDTESLCADFFYEPYRISHEARKKWVEDSASSFKKLLDTLEANTAAFIVFHNFKIPTHSSLGILENKQAFGFHEAVEFLNADLRNRYKDSTRIFCFDYEAFCGRIGKDNLVDTKLYYLADIRIDRRHAQKMAHEYLSYIKPMLSLTKKCIVLDLDNTLWGGVVGEDGMEGIKLGPTPEGRSFWEFQKYLLSLQQRGVLLAVNSKNNEEDALKVLKEHPHMILREEHFQSIQINWNDKASNMKAIADELNIGLDSFVFIDDDVANRELVRRLLPEVVVFDLPEDPSQYLDAFMRSNDFNTLQITEEDMRRGEMYAISRKASEAMSSSGSVNDFVRSLSVKIEILSADDFTLPRIAQLTQKTNQFNATTRRYSEDDIVHHIKEGWIVHGYHVWDIFGDYGITGVTMIRTEGDVWFMDTFLLSCRVLGKHVELAIMGAIMKAAAKRHVQTVFAEIVPTSKNQPVRGLYESCGFTSINSDDGVLRYSFSLKKDQCTPPDYIQTIGEVSGPS